MKFVQHKQELSKLWFSLTGFQCEHCWWFFTHENDNLIPITGQLFMSTELIHKHLKCEIWVLGDLEVLGGVHTILNSFSEKEI